jgi:hypothetical protein
LAAICKSCSDLDYLAKVDASVLCIHHVELRMGGVIICAWRLF